MQCVPRLLGGNFRKGQEGNWDGEARKEGRGPSVHNSLEETTQTLPIYGDFLWGHGTRFQPLHRGCGCAKINSFEISDCRHWKLLYMNKIGYVIYCHNNTQNKLIKLPSYLCIIIYLFYLLPLSQYLLSSNNKG